MKINDLPINNYYLQCKVETTSTKKEILFLVYNDDVVIASQTVKIIDGTARFLFRVGQKKANKIRFYSSLSYNESINKTAKFSEIMITTFDKQKYVQYYEPQHFYVTTENSVAGLMGIPVTSGGNYVDENGQHWVSDYIDFSEGKIVRNIFRLSVDEMTNLFTWGVNKNAKDITGFYSYVNDIGKPSGLIANAVCDFLQFEKGIFGGYRLGAEYNLDGHVTMCVKTADLLDKDSDVITNKEAIVKFKEFAKGEAIYYVVSPYEELLTNEQLEYYKQLLMYKDSTIVENSENAHMSITYKATDN